MILGQCNYVLYYTLLDCEVTLQPIKNKMFNSHHQDRMQLQPILIFSNKSVMQLRTVVFKVAWDFIILYILKIIMVCIYNVCHLLSQDLKVLYKRHRHPYVTICHKGKTLKKSVENWSLFILWWTARLLRNRTVLYNITSCRTLKCQQNH